MESRTKERLIGGGAIALLAWWLYRERCARLALEAAAAQAHAALPAPMPHLAAPLPMREAMKNGAATATKEADPVKTSPRSPHPGGDTVTASSNRVNGLGFYTLKGGTK